MTRDKKDESSPEKENELFQMKKELSEITPEKNDELSPEKKEDPLKEEEKKEEPLRSKKEDAFQGRGKRMLVCKICRTAFKDAGELVTHALSHQ